MAALAGDLPGDDAAGATPGEAIADAVRSR